MYTYVSDLRFASSVHRRTGNRAGHTVARTLLVYVAFFLFNYAVRSVSVIVLYEIFHRINNCNSSVPSCPNLIYSVVNGTFG